MKILFLDESGDHNLSVIDQQYPLFVLGGIIVDKNYAESILEEKLRQFKMNLFGNDQIILHTADISRNKNGFEQLKDKFFREKFYEKLNELMASLEYKVVACAIKKEIHLTQYGIAALDPYILSLDILLERFCFEVGNVQDGGMVIAEKRNPTLDHELDLAWLNLKIKGTHYLQAKEIEKRVSAVITRPKTDNIAGLQLADLVVSPIGRFVLKKKIKEDFKIIESKFRKNHLGEYIGMGLVVLPK
jgi:hypothetical protein